MHKDVPIFINIKDRLSLLERLLLRLISQGYLNIFLLDTGSTYPPMLRWLKQRYFPTIYVEGKIHPEEAIWNTDALQKVNVEGNFYVYTDCDVVPDLQCPDDWADHFFRLLEKYPQFPKVGFGLRIDDLPDVYSRKGEVIAWESQFWKRTFEPDIYDAAIDTTFALYRPDSKGNSAAIRTGGKYMAQHLPWYADSLHPTEEEKWYKSHMVDGVGSWR